MKPHNNSSKKIKLKKPFNSNMLTAFVAVFVVVGAVTLLTSLAAPAPNGKSAEAETGSSATNTVNITDASASGGSYLNFKAQTTTTTGAFQANFETSADFYNRFDYFVGNHCSFYENNCRLEDYPNEIQSWNGDHNMACESPATSRTVDVGNHNEYFWWCAPRGPESGHIMTAQNMNGYGIISFTPKQSFTNVNKVCWDVNMTDMGGGKWFNVVIIPQSEYVRHANTNPLRAQEGEGPYRQDYTTIGFNDDNSPGDFNLQQQDLRPGNDIWGFRSFRGTLQVFKDETDLWNNGFGDPVDTTDKAARFRHCLTNGPNNTLNLTRARPDGTTDNITMPNVHLPAGEVKVIFQDDNYDPPKREGYSPNNLTWHWDNILVE